MRLLLPDAAMDLLVEDSPGEWRVGHSLVAEEILRQIMSRGSDPRTWQNHLADWGIDFVNFCRGVLPSPSAKLLDVVRRVFVFRDDVDILGHEQSAQSRFSNFIQALPVSEGKLRVLNELVESFPEEHHFWAHLARFYALDRKDFDEALRCGQLCHSAFRSRFSGPSYAWHGTPIPTQRDGTRGFRVRRPGGYCREGILRLRTIPCYCTRRTNTRTSLKLRWSLSSLITSLRQKAISSDFCRDTVSLPT